MMDLAAFKEWLGILAPYIMGAGGIALAIYQSRLTLRRVDGRMDELERSWEAKAHQMVLDARAEALVPSAVAEAAAIVKADAKDAREALRVP